jgi:hypothetical protein
MEYHDKNELDLDVCSSMAQVPLMYSWGGATTTTSAAQIAAHPLRMSGSSSPSM